MLSGAKKAMRFRPFIVRLFEKILRPDPDPTNETCTAENDANITVLRNVVRVRELAKLLSVLHSLRWGRHIARTEIKGEKAKLSTSVISNRFVWSSLYLDT